MTNKESYLLEIQAQHPDLTADEREFVWYCHTVDKALDYLQTLRSCTCNADIAKRVICPMYQEGHIDVEQAKNRSFLDLLGRLACREKETQGRAIAYHVDKWLTDELRKERRQRMDKARRQSEEGSTTLILNFRLEVRNRGDIVPLLDHLSKLGMIQFDELPNYVSGGHSLRPDLMGNNKPVLEAYYYQVTGVETAMEPLIQTLKEKGIDYAIIP